MNVKINLSDVFKNTSTHLGDTIMAFEEAGISKDNPIEFGKFVIVIKHNVSDLMPILLKCLLLISTIFNPFNHL